jgi:hypothetical protein
MDIYRKQALLDLAIAVGLGMTAGVCFSVGEWGREQAQKETIKKAQAAATINCGCLSQAPQQPKLQTRPQSGSTPTH